MKIRLSNLLKNFKTSANTSISSKIIQTYYSDYPIKPYISENRDKKWIEQANMFKNMLIPIDMMTPFSDGLLPGHIYMLYWINNIHRKSIPAYFEYKYGIDFIKEIDILIERGYLTDNFHLTDKGIKVLEKHNDIILKHNNKNRITKEHIVEQIQKQRTKMLKNGFSQYVYHADSKCCEKCKKLDGKIFQTIDMIPGVNAPPMCDNCRCYISPYEDNKEYEEWLDHIANGGTTESFNNTK